MQDRVVIRKFEAEPVDTARLLPRFVDRFRLLPQQKKTSQGRLTV
jgi:hypothetical protein